MEHCFGGEETVIRKESLRWILCTFKKRRRNSMKSNIYLKQKLLKNTFTVKRYGKGILIQINEEEVYKIITNKTFTEDEDNVEVAAVAMLG